MTLTRNETVATRIMRPEEAKQLIGQPVPVILGPVLPSPASPEEPSWLLDGTTGEVVAIVTKMPPDVTAALREAILRVDVYATGVSRAKIVRAYLPARIFGYKPRKPQVKRDACHVAALDRDYPDVSALLRGLAGDLGRQFRELMPERAELDHAVVHQIRNDWILSDDALWTSGVINQSAQLPYHNDGANFHTWSAMPTLRYGMRGGLLHLAEYGILFPCRDGEVTWFCGRDLVHGVTPMKVVADSGYRYSIVYYALSGMVDCRTFAEETAMGAVRRTRRERDIAEKAKARL